MRYIVIAFLNSMERLRKANDLWVVPILAP
jgi:hypothetical protein